MADLPPRPAPQGVQPRATTLFVGSIARGVNDAWLRALFEACGPVRAVTRPNPAFAFVEYVEPTSVAQALRALAGRELPSVPAGAGPSKALSVKADAKTTAYMDQWRAGAAGAAAEADDGAHAGASERVGLLVEAMKRGDAPPPVGSDLSVSTPASMAAQEATRGHLQDLDKTVLPDDRRGAIIGEIAAFRNTAAVKAAEQRRSEAVRAAALGRERMAREQREQREQREREMQGYGHDRMSRSASAGWPRSPYPSRPESSASPSRSAVDTGIDPLARDELDEELRLQQVEVTKKNEAIAAERRYLDQEERRIARWKQLDTDEEWRTKQKREAAVRQARKMAEYDPTSELFVADRSRWRHGRSQYREQERLEDERLKEEDARFEAAERERAQRTAEEQRAAGVLLPQTSAQPIRITLGKSHVVEDPVAQASPASAPSDNGAGQTAAAVDPAVLEQQRAALPTALADIGKYTPDWARVSARQEDYRKWIDARVTEVMDESVPELVDALLEKMTAQATAEDMVAEIEPALDEDAEPLVAAFWRILVADSM